MRGYFLCCDLLGFSQLVRSAEPEERDRLLRTWIEDVSKCASLRALTKRSFFSDTLFAASGPSDDEFVALLRFCQDVLTNSTTLGLPVRGGIAFGEYEWGESVTGAAVLEAHEAEQATDWIGIACAHGMKAPQVAFDEGLLLCYAPPRKEGDVTFGSVVDWDVPLVEVLIAQMGFKKHREGQAVSWEVLRKVRNTAEFGLYRRLIQQHGLNRHECYLHPPVLALERIARGEPPFPPEVLASKRLRR
jgi:hypothetical protein